MKYFYVYKNSIADYLSTGKDIKYVEKDDDKMVVIKEGKTFHVLESNNGIYKEDVRSFCFYDLCRYIRNIDKNLYFFNMDKDEASIAVQMSRSELKHKNIERKEKEHAIYTVKDGKLLKVTASIQCFTLATAIKECYTAELLDNPSSFKRIGLEEFVSNPELVKVYHFPVKTVNNQFVVPPHSYSSPDLFYVLSSMYDNHRSFIPLSEEELRNLYMFSYSKQSNIVEKVLDSLFVKTEEEYDLNGLEESVKQLEDFKEKEGDNDIQLDNVKKIIRKAKSNEQIFRDLGLLDKLSDTKDKTYSKGTIE